MAGPKNRSCSWSRADAGPRARAQVVGEVGVPECVPRAAERDDRAAVRGAQGLPNARRDDGVAPEERR